MADDRMVAVEVLICVLKAAFSIWKKWPKRRKFGETRHSNPFLADGVLSKKADYILTHSTITRTELHIADPDAIRVEAIREEDEEEKEEAVVVSDKAGNTTATEPASPVEVEVRQTMVTVPGRQKAEEVQLKKHKKCKCCTVQ